jgi:hypothetical protein
MGVGGARLGVETPLAPSSPPGRGGCEKRYFTYTRGRKKVRHARSAPEFSNRVQLAFGEKGQPAPAWGKTWSMLSAAEMKKDISRKKVRQVQSTSWLYKVDQFHLFPISGLLAAPVCWELESR